MRNRKPIAVAVTLSILLHPLSAAVAASSKDASAAAVAVPTKKILLGAASLLLGVGAISSGQSRASSPGSTTGGTTTGGTTTGGTTTGGTTTGGTTTGGTTTGGTTTGGMTTTGGSTSGNTPAASIVSLANTPIIPADSPLAPVGAIATANLLSNPGASGAPAVTATVAGLPVTLGGAQGLNIGTPSSTPGSAANVTLLQAAPVLSGAATGTFLQ